MQKTFNNTIEDSIMAILDIRKEQEEEITGIKFDDSPDLISFNEGSIHFITDDEEILLCNIEDFDNFIAALHKAKELAGK